MSSCGCAAGRPRQHEGSANLLQGRFGNMALVNPTSSSSTTSRALWKLPRACSTKNVDTATVAHAACHTRVCDTCIIQMMSHWVGCHTPQ